MPRNKILQKFHQNLNKVRTNNYDYSQMGYTWNSMLTSIPGEYRVVVKYKGKEIYNQISNNYSTMWIIEEHIKINERK